MFGFAEIRTYCDGTAKLVAPAADRLVADYHPTLEQQRFDVAQAELKSEVPTHGMADDRRRESVAVIK
ncbi:hypothetical protein MB84_27660 (plasmid) [Pandoraea oxalativorans]|uniref:Uncharacterized protein n=1 Tax=Pandoraea oxalativorans TaxID=573737 RepID=A0A0G3IFC8_9BURK|nr:hypothetical protein MB84_27660 [Pandoraea oxalativorans]